MFPLPLICLSLGILTPLASANVEKTIFLGPEPISIHPTLSDLNIDSLTPEAWSLRTHLEAIFPTGELARGRPAWLMLDNLAEGQRYEVRVCWLATVSFSFLSFPFLSCHASMNGGCVCVIYDTIYIQHNTSLTHNTQQPTDFHLQTYTLPAVLDTPELMTSLHNYSVSRQPALPATTTTTTGRQSSALLLRIDAAASYFSPDRALMARPEPVAADVILDPFVCNVLPRTLVPTVGYVVLVAGLSWVLSTRLVAPWLRGLMVEGEPAVGVEQEQERKRK